MYRHATCWRQSLLALRRRHACSHSLHKHFSKLEDIFFCANSSGLGFLSDNILKIVSKEKRGNRLPSFERFGVVTVKLRVRVWLPCDKEVWGLFHLDDLPILGLLFSQGLCAGCQYVSISHRVFVGREPVIDVFVLCEQQRRREVQSGKQHLRLPT